MLNKIKSSKSFIFVSSLFLFSASFVQAEAIQEQENLNPKIETSEKEDGGMDIDVEKARNNLKNHFPPEAEIKGIEYSGVAGIYFFHVGGQAMMFTNEGDYIINGGFFDMKNESTNLVDNYMSKYYVETLQSFNDEDKIIYKPEDTEVRAEVIVFTDPSCPYCTKFHNKMDEYLSYGIQVEYLPFPRGGKSGPGYADTLKTWCADTQEKRKQLMSAAKNGNNPPILANQKVNEECTSNLEKLLQMNQSLNISGTPAVFLESGRQVGGYLEPAELLREIVKDEKNKKQ